MSENTALCALFVFTVSIDVILLVSARRFKWDVCPIGKADQDRRKLSTRFPRKCSCHFLRVSAGPWELYEVCLQRREDLENLYLGKMQHYYTHEGLIVETISTICSDCGVPWR